MMINDKEYTEHSVFLELQSYIAFYKNFSMSVMSFPTMGTTAMCNMDTYVLSSIQGTIDSISLLLKKGRINDSYALLRKYYDSAIINIYANLYLTNNSSIETFIVEKINNWLNGKNKLPEFRVMSQYIRNSEELKAINDCLYADEKYKNIRNRCNDHTHYNYFHNLLLNDNEIFLKNRLKELNQISSDVKDIFILHLSYIFYLNDHYMMSSDYIDHLDCGMTPPENSQYWVSPVVQQIFNDVIKSKRNDIASLIKSKTCMQLK